MAQNRLLDFNDFIVIMGVLNLRKKMTKLQNRLQNAALYLVCVFIACEHIPHMTSAKNISLYVALACAIWLYFTDRTRFAARVGANFSLSRVPAFCLIAFAFYAFLISAFPYAPQFDSLGNAAKEFGRGFAFLFIIYVLANGEIAQTKAFFYALIAAFAIISIYYAAPLFSEFERLGSAGEFDARVVRRAYADYVDRFLPFALAGVFIFKRLWARVSCAALFLAAAWLDILSGVRGSWGAMLACFVMFGFCLYILGGEAKRKFKVFAVIFAVCVVGASAAVLSSPTAMYKFVQIGLVSEANLENDSMKKRLAGLSFSSGRDLILKERLPLLFANPRAITGLGHGKEQYDAFLRDEADKGAQISMMQTRPSGERYWFNDEPFFIGHYYYYGAVGTALMFGGFISLLAYAFRHFLRSRELLFAAIFISLACYFGVRGLFEAINLRILYMFYMLGFFVLLVARTGAKGGGVER